MMGTGVRVAEISAICLTHLDRDHFNINWIETIMRRGIRVHCHADRLAHLRAFAEVAGEDAGDRFAAMLVPFDGDAFEPVAGVRMRPLRLVHDRTGSHGFVIEGHGCRVGYATDLGTVPSTLLECFEDLDVLAIESNYDPDMQVQSGRPWFLKNRIMGGRGHLSNQQAFDAIRRILGRCETRGRHLPQHIVLLHRSRQCNCPQLVRRFFSQDARIATRLTLAEQYERTEWIRTRNTPPLCGEQMRLGFAVA